MGFPKHVTVLLPEDAKPHLADSLGIGRPNSKMMSEFFLSIPGVQKQGKTGIGEWRVATNKTEKAGTVGEVQACGYEHHLGGDRGPTDLACVWMRLGKDHHHMCGIQTVVCMVRGGYYQDL